MNFVLFHMGSKLPTHIKYCIKQIKCTNPGYKIYFLTNLNIEIPRDETNVEIINISKYNVPCIDNYFKHDPHHMQLWQTSVYRLFYLEQFAKDHDLKDIIHFDNDVLLYNSLDKLLPLFKKYNFLITPHFETEYVFGFSYIKDYSSLTYINNKMLELVTMNRDDLVSTVNHQTPHEMRLLNFINNQNDNKLIDHLPVTPKGDGSDNFNKFNVIFDPSTYGKHLTGSHCLGNHNDKFINTSKWHGTEIHHYAGKMIADGDIEVDFKDKKPFIVCDDKEYPLVNLHVHTKNLGQFISDGL